MRDSIQRAVGGAVALIERQIKDRGDVVFAYRLLEETFDCLRSLDALIFSYESDADRIYRGFPARIRQELGDDARIAAVAILHGATVWTCNVRDYAKVPGLSLVDAATGVEPVARPQA